MQLVSRRHAASQVVAAAHALTGPFESAAAPGGHTRLADAGLATRAGTGIRRMIRLVREATGQEVEIQVRDFEVLVTNPRKTPES